MAEKDLYDACVEVYDTDRCPECSIEARCHEELVLAQADRKRPDLSFANDMGEHSCGRTSHDIANALLSRIAGSHHMERIAVKWLAKHLTTIQDASKVKRFFFESGRNRN